MINIAYVIFTTQLFIVSTYTIELTTKRFELLKNNSYPNLPIQKLNYVLVVKI